MDKHIPLLDVKIVIDPKGPYSIYGNLSVFEYFIINGNDGKALRYEQGNKNYSTGEVTHLCRCGTSKKKPYCDGSHLKTQWDSELTALNDRFMNGVKIYEGPEYTLYDKESLCCVARFCSAHNGAWNMIMSPQSQQEIEQSVQVALMCPAGRLVVQERKSGKILEPHMECSIGLIEDTPMGLSGPLWIRGGVPIVTKNGEEIERRNRITLCRCGASIRKPYCDGMHLKIGFKDDNFD